MPPREPPVVARPAEPAVGGACAECHAEIVARYAQSGMSRSWRAAAPDEAAVLPLPGFVNDERSGYRYEVAVRSGAVWQIETHRGDPPHRAERRAAYLVGSGRHAVALVASENGFLTELPAGWFAAGGWRMNPGYELKNHRFSRPITLGCVACHATGAVHESPTANRFASVAGGIECRRCHGEPAPHVAFWKQAGAADPPPAARLVDPGRLSADRANDVCLQCHLQGDAVVPLAGHSPLGFQPGRRLLDERHDFLIAGQAELLGIASHGARMLQSRCYTASNGQLTCLHCHDPHAPAAAATPAQYDAKCGACHESSSCRRPRNEPQTSAASCVGCHMPKRPTREGLHLIFTDHAIRRQPAMLTAARPPVLAANAQVELQSAWPGATPDAATLGAAYVLLHETMGPQEPSLAAGYKLLAAAVAKNPDDFAGRYWLGSAALALGRAAEARSELGHVLARQPEHHEARYRLALAEEAAGNTQAAVQHYEHLRSAAPDWPQPRARLAQLYLARQDAAAAARAWGELAALEPSASALASLALAEQLAGASHEQALATLRRALALDSREPGAYVTRGTLGLLSGQAAAARADFARALLLDPENAAAQQALEALGNGRP